MKKTTLVIIASLIVIAATVFLNFRRGQQAPEIETATVVRGDVAISVFASGKIESENYRELSFAGGGEVAVVNVAEGDKVVKGQILAALDQQSLRESLVQAEAGLQRARADLDYAGETRRLFLDEHKYDGPSEETFAQFGQQDAQVRKAVAAVELTNSQVESARISLNNSVLASPISGTIVEINIKEGESFSAGEPVIIVADLSSFVFEAEVDESEIEKVEVGQKVRVNLDASSDTDFESRVSEIARMTTLDSSGNKIVEVRVDLNLKGLEKLWLGLSGDAEIILREKEDVLLIPSEAVSTEDGKNFVYLVEGDNKMIKREVKLGLENDDTVEVVFGLSEGEKINVNPDRKSNKNLRTW